MLAAVALSSHGQGTVYTVNGGNATNNVYALLAFSSTGLVQNQNLTVSADWTDASVTVNQMNNGVLSTYQGIDIIVLQDAYNAHGQYADELNIAWGPNYADGFFVDYPVGTITNAASWADVASAMELGLSESSSFNGNVMDYGYNSNFQGGTEVPLTSFSVQFQTVLPALSIKPSAKNAALTWPTNAAGFQLQSSSLLGTNANWKTITNSVAIAGTNYCLTLPVTNRAAFFRLQSTN